MHRNLKVRIHAAASFLGSWALLLESGQAIIIIIITETYIPSNIQGQLSTRGGEGEGCCRSFTARKGRFDIWAAFAPNVLSTEYSAEHLFTNNCLCCISSTTYINISVQSANNNSLSPSLLLHVPYVLYLLRPFLWYCNVSSSSSSSSRLAAGHFG
jgi:hypothetical protein